MNIKEIKQAVDSGQRVFWNTTLYEVIKDNIGQYHIVCGANDSCIGLHGKEGTEYENVLNGCEKDFFIEPIVY